MHLSRRHGPHLHGRTETRDRDRDIREGLRNRGYEVVEIQFGQLTDPDAMRQHFFRIGRFLLGKDAAQRFGTIPPGTPAADCLRCPAKDSWTEVIGLLDSPWHPLAQGLRLAGLRSPDEVDWDWIEAGKVSGKRALMMWSTKTGYGGSGGCRLWNRTGSEHCDRRTNAPRRQRWPFY